jgi:hypothetical protein
VVCSNAYSVWLLVTLDNESVAQTETSSRHSNRQGSFVVRHRPRRSLVIAFEQFEAEVGVHV